MFEHTEVKMPTVPLSEPFRQMALVMTDYAHKYWREGKRILKESAEFWIAYTVKAEVETTGREGGNGSDTAVTLEFESGLSVEIDVQSADGSVHKFCGPARIQIRAHGDFEAELLSRALTFHSEVLKRVGFVPDIWSK